MALNLWTHSASTLHDIHFRPRGEVAAQRLDSRRGLRIRARFNVQDMRQRVVLQRLQGDAKPRVVAELLHGFVGRYELHMRNIGPLPDIALELLSLGEAERPFFR